MSDTTTAVGSFEQISNLVLARHPIISIVSHEEARVIRELRRIGKENHVPVYEWSCTQGVKGPNKENDDECTTPDAILDKIAAHESNGMFVLKDFHHYLLGGIPDILRAVRDLAAELPMKRAKRYCVLLSPVPVIPIELEKDIAMVDFDLPGRPELDNVLDRLQRSRQKENKEALPYYNDPEIRGSIIDAGRGLTQSEFENVVAMSVAKLKDVSIKAILREKQSIIKRNHVLEYHEVNTTMAEVGGLVSLKKWIDQRKNAYSPEAREYGLPSPKGVLLLGIPGVGKSLTAKVIGNAWGRPTIRMDMGRVFGSLVGESEANVRSAIKTCEAVSPCVLWIN